MEETRVTCRKSLTNLTHNVVSSTEQTTKWPKEKSTKGQTTIYKTYTYN
jgi:hypothetical protein